MTSNTQRWTKKRPTAEQQRATARERAFQQCKRGKHSLTNTFRPGEQVCTSCGLVVYCAACLNEHKLQVAPNRHTFPLLCKTRRNAEVQV